MQQNQKGFSIVEVLIASTMLLSLVAFFTYFGGRNKQKIVSTNDKQCLEVAEETMNKLRSIGFEKEVVYSNGPNGTLATQTKDRIDLTIPANQLHQVNNEPLIEGNNPYYLQNYKSIVGVMSFLSDLYNTIPQVRFEQANPNKLGINITSDARIRNEFRMDVDDTSGRLRNINNYILIQPQKLTTNVPAVVGTDFTLPLKIRPPGANTTATGNLYIASEAPNVLPDPQAQFDIGFVVKVTTEYQNPENILSRCAVATLFKYPIKRVPKEFGDPNAVDASIVIDSAINAECAPKNTTSARLTITMPGINAPREKNYTLLCSDRSQIAGEGEFPYASPSCSDSVKRATNADLANNPAWVPCERVAICGVAPNGIPNRGPASLTVYYNNVALPWGCRPQISIRLVDAAMNVAQNAIAAPAGNPTSDTRICHPCTPDDGDGWCFDRAANCTPPSPPPGTGTDGMDGGEGDGGDGGDGAGVDGSNGH